MQGGRVAAALGLALALGGCPAGRPPPSPDAVRDEGTCVPVTDAVRIGPTTTVPGTLALYPSVGMVGGHVLVSWSIYWPATPERGARSFAQWLDAALVVDGPPIALGNGPYAVRSRWVRDGDLLAAQIWTNGDELVPPVSAYDAHETAAIWSLRPAPSAAAVRQPITLPVPPPGDECPECALVFTGHTYSPGDQLSLPGALGVRGAAHAISALPSVCLTRFANGRRAMVLDTSIVEPLLWDEPPCHIDTSRYEQANLWLMNLDDGGLGLFFRRDPLVPSRRDFLGSLVHYTRLDESFHPIGEPIDVDIGEGTSMVDGGNQPRAVRLGGGRILYGERLDAGLNRCQVLGVMSDDGSEFRRAPWQLPCFFQSYGYEDWLTSSYELEPLPDGRAVVAWTERTHFPRGYEYLQRLNTVTEWEEAIHLAMIAEDGYRASPIVEVTVPESTAVDWSGPRDEVLGPWPANFLISMATEGEEVVVVWTDLRLDAPGFYGRRFRCAAAE